MVKKNKPRTTINVDAIKKGAQRLAKEITQGSPNHQFGKELAPGSVRRESPREQEMGSSKYRKMIHDHNKNNKHILDRLPFTFPKKRKIRSHLHITLVCPECDEYLLGSENTYMVICTGCKKLVKPHNPEAERNGLHNDIKVGIFGTATDKLRLLEEKDKSGD